MCINNQHFTTISIKCEQCGQANPKIPGKSLGTTWLHLCPITILQNTISPECRTCAMCGALNPNYRLSLFNIQKTYTVTIPLTQSEQ